MLCYQEVHFLLSELHLLTLACPSYLHFLDNFESSELNLSLPLPQRNLCTALISSRCLKCYYSIESPAGMVPVGTAELTCCLLTWEGLPEHGVGFPSGVLCVPCPVPSGQVFCESPEEGMGGWR